MPAEASVLAKGSPIRGSGLVSVAIFENKDGSVGAAISGSVAQHSFSSERIDFEVKPGEVCTVLLSGKEQLDVYRPAAFVSDTKIVFPSSKRLMKQL